MGACHSQGETVQPRKHDTCVGPQSPKADEWPLHFSEHVRTNQKLPAFGALRHTILEVGTPAHPGFGRLSTSSQFQGFCGGCYDKNMSIETCVSPRELWLSDLHADRESCHHAAATAGSLLDSSRPDFMTLAECFQPLLSDVVGYLAETPCDVARICSEVSRTVTSQSTCAAAAAWRDMFERTWPACFECLQHRGVQSYRNVYEEMSLGRIEFQLEVFDREKKRGFAMSAMPAKVHFQAKHGFQGSYLVKYISASDVPPEFIPLAEEHRLRYCPAAVREALAPPNFRKTSLAMPPPVLPVPPADTMPVGVAAALLRSQALDGKVPQYPHKVLTGFTDLVVGRPVELQWKMQFGSPFGWWYGHLDRLTRHDDGVTATATITFAHFPSNSRWHRLEVRFGDDTVRACSFGGYTGGLSQVSEAGQERWMRFFPKEPIVF